MATMTVTTRITHRYLMNKTKYELASMVLDALDNADDLRRQLDERNSKCKWNEDDDSNWRGTCGIVWYLGEERPDTIPINYCPRCGHLVSMYDES